MPGGSSFRNVLQHEPESAVRRSRRALIARQLRDELGFARYTEAQFMEKLCAAGFSPERMAKNVEHNPARMTFRARLTS